MNSDNFEKYYDSPELYDRCFHLKIDDIPFYFNQASQVEGIILDLACGTGRITIPLAKAGIKIWGIDNSDKMLQLARLKSDAEALEIPFILADGKSFQVNQKFSMIFIGFNSLWAMTSLLSLQSLFQSVKSHMEPQAIFCFDILNPNHTSNELQKNSSEVAQLSPQQWDELLQTNGFKIQKKFGSFKKKNFDPEDPAQIFICGLK